MSSFLGLPNLAEKVVLFAAFYENARYKATKSFINHFEHYYCNAHFELKQIGMEMVRDYVFGWIPMNRMKTLQRLMGIMYVYEKYDVMVGDLPKHKRSEYEEVIDGLLVQDVFRYFVETNPQIFIFIEKNLRAFGYTVVNKNGDFFEDALNYVPILCSILEYRYHIELSVRKRIPYLKLWEGWKYNGVMHNEVAIETELEL